MTTYGHNKKKRLQGIVVCRPTFTRYLCYNQLAFWRLTINFGITVLGGYRLGNRVAVWETGVSRHNGGAIEGPLCKLLDTVVAWYTGGFRRPSIGPPLCRETLERPIPINFGLMFDVSIFTVLSMYFQQWCYIIIINGLILPL